MNLFLDTSSLIKLYYKEDGTDNLDLIFSNYLIDEIFLSEISITEFYSAIYKKVRTKDLSLKNADDILKSFIADRSKYNFISVDSKVIDSSRTLIEKYGIDGLRALDAIQFASVYNLKESIDIVVSAELLNTFLTLEGIEVS